MFYSEYSADVKELREKISAEEKEGLDVTQAKNKVFNLYMKE